jgi:hypothetical protein
MEVKQWLQSGLSLGRQLVLAAALALTAVAATAGGEVGFENDGWDQLLQAHVVTAPDGLATSVDYAGMLAARPQLRQYLQRLADVTPATFDGWDKASQLAFLINAYNAWTVELILTAYPQVESIKDLGSLFRSPWSKSFIPLLGETRSLDDIEHELIRGSGKYPDPRIHFAVNCASIGCPALREEAYNGAELDAQLAEQTRRFLLDRSRNRGQGAGLAVSSIFKWYRGDFERGWAGYTRLEDFLLDYTEALDLSAAQIAALRQGKSDIRFLDYDWRLNKAP